MAGDEGDREWDRLTRAVGRAAFFLWCRYDRVKKGDTRIVSIKFLLDADAGTSVLGVLQGVREGVRVVAFVGGPDLCSAILAAGKRARAGTLKWREDRPYKV